MQPRPAVTFSAFVLVLGALVPSPATPVGDAFAGDPSQWPPQSGNTPGKNEASLGQTLAAGDEARFDPSTYQPHPSEPRPMPVQPSEFDTAVFMAQFVPAGRAGTPVDVAVHANDAVAQMEVQVDYGPWQSMRPGLGMPFPTALAGGPWEYWTWSASPPMGSLVVFRATSTTGQEAFSYPYSWAPNGD